MWKGTSLTSVNWKVSENIDRLIITNEKFWRSTLIYYLYSQKNKESNYLFFSPTLPDDFFTQIRAVKPDNTSKWGDMPENWTSNGSPDHFFDVCKEAMFARDFALNSFYRKRYRFGKSPMIVKRFEKQIAKESQQKQSEIKKRSDWFKL